MRLTLLVGVVAFLITSLGLIGISNMKTEAEGDSPMAWRVMSTEEQSQRYQPGAAWAGAGRLGTFTESDLTAFAGYPIFWLGASFAGYNLQTVKHVKYDAPPGVPSTRGMDAVTMIYGACTPVEGATACVAPITLRVRPLCSVTPVMVAEAAKSGPLSVVGDGARVQKFRDGHSVIWTGDSMIELHFMADPGRTDEAAALTPIGESARAGLSATDAANLEKCDAVDLEKEQIRTS